MLDPIWFPQIHAHACTGCGECINQCPENALTLVNGKATLALPDACSYCAACEDICPNHAIELPYLICKPEPRKEKD